MSDNIESLARLQVGRPLEIYVKYGELYRLPPTVLGESDPDNELPLDFSFRYKSDLLDEDLPLSAPTSFMVDGIAFSTAQPTLLQDLPLARINGYPRFCSADEVTIAEMKDLDADEELRGEIVIPHQDARLSLMGRLSVYLLSKPG